MADARTITLEARFNGPPGSANGGYACGMAATAVTDGPAEVALRRPPPLEVPLDVVLTDLGGEVHHDGQVVAVVAAWDGQLDLPPAVPAATVTEAAAAFDVDAYAASHAFPRCFTCGPGRPDGDGLGLYPAPVPGTGTVVWPWAPADDTAGDDGLVAAPILWAALDCPTGLAWMNAPDGSATGPAVLGRLAVRIDRRPAVGEPLVVEGWQREAEGRKLHALGAVRSTDGEVLAVSKATWVVLDAEQAAAFGAS
jgi:hypothetical protein